MIKRHIFYRALILIGCLLVFFAGQARADEFLEVEQAFKLNGQVVDGQKILLDWTIAPGYKLYKQRLSINSVDQDAKLSEPVLPKGTRKFDDNLGEEVETYHDRLQVTLPYKAEQPFTLMIGYQGCADAGLCYPPVNKTFTVDPAIPGMLKEVLPEATDTSPEKQILAESVSETPVNEGELAQQTLRGGNLLSVALVFFGFGLLLSFTPCVLPMVPILSSIIVGQGQVTKRRGFTLAMAYSFGMALVYTAMGVAAGLAGEGLAAALQKPWVLASFASLLFVLALSMFDVYQLQLPASWQTRLSATSDRMQSGRYLGVFSMGAISALIVGPCVAAPLAGALVYISQSQDVFLGGWALFSMAMGMSVPLLLTGLSAGSLLPRMGAWMNEVKHVFGFMLIAVALWMVTPILPEWLLLLVWGSFALVCAVFLHVFEPLKERAGMGARVVKAIGALFLIVSVFELLGAASGGHSVLQPLGHLRVSGAVASPSAQPVTHFTRIRNVDELNKVLQTSQHPVLLDFYADWCVACKEMERFTFSDPKVVASMAEMTLLQVDVTKNADEEKVLLKQFGLFGPPAIILFNREGKEIPDSRIIGFKEATAFARNLQHYVANKI